MNSGELGRRFKVPPRQAYQYALIVPSASRLLVQLSYLRLIRISLPQPAFALPLAVRSFRRLRRSDVRGWHVAPSFVTHFRAFHCHRRRGAVTVSHGMRRPVDVSYVARAETEFHRRNQLLHLAAAAIAFSAATDALHAQAFPALPITMIVPYGAGGGPTDAIARILA
jgi:hypothetical protein